MFERHSPLLDIEEVFDRLGGDVDLRSTVRRLYGLIAASLGREPRVAPALLAESLARPESPAVQNLLQHNAPRILGSLGAWLIREVAAGRIRDIPLPLLIQQLLAPIVIHMLARPVMPQLPGVEVPDLDTVCDTFTEAFLGAVATAPAKRKSTRRRP